ncbi:MAG: D-glycero-beta-D-manno-heptose 1-phosphate adenylyltransferase [Candidatus Omnitrophica bacterium]|nr:D-glycero-beta-D-manno-heptose 1-phosphate adenylyltransferase [Candidatus Omnitrophota bacterium]
MFKEKVKKSTILGKILKKQKNKRVVFTNGCFDILHYGHVKYLEDAKSKGDILVVGINSDSSVKTLKGNLRPIVPEKERAFVIAALESVDYVVIFDELTPLELIKKLKPEVLVKGADWKKKNIIGAGFVENYGGKVARIKFLVGYSTTKIIKKISKIEL